MPFLIPVLGTIGLVGAEMWSFTENGPFGQKAYDKGEGIYAGNKSAPAPAPVAPTSPAADPAAVATDEAKKQTDQQRRAAINRPTALSAGDISSNTSYTTLLGQ